MELAGMEVLERRNEGGKEQEKGLKSNKVT